MEMSRTDILLRRPGLKPSAAGDAAGVAARLGRQRFAGNGSSPSGRGGRVPNPRGCADGGRAGLARAIFVHVFRNAQQPPDFFVFPVRRFLHNHAISVQGIDTTLWSG